MSIASSFKASLILIICTFHPFAAGAQTHETGDVQSWKKIIFAQPVLSGIAGNLHVPPAEHRFPSEQVFNLLLWQPNPNRSDGQLVPTDWQAGGKTGFYATAPLREHQAAFRDAAGSSTVQIAGETVGVYLNSGDLPNGSSGDKMMITPEFKLPKEQWTYPFAQPGNAIVESVQLQVPVASDINKPGNMTYAVSALLFEDRKTHSKISYEAGLFHHAPGPRSPSPPSLEHLKKTEVHGFDGPSQAFQVNNPLAAGSRIFTVIAGSTLSQHQPWKGWRSFDFAITRENFQTSLRSLREKASAFTGSQDPADYALVEWHLNAELKFGSAPAELGWSMRQARVELVPENRL